MLEDVAGLDAAQGVDDEDLREQVLRLAGDLVGPWHLELSCLDLEEQVADVSVVLVEGESAGEQGKQDHTAGPDVAGEAVVGDTRDDFGRGVVGRPAGGLEQLVLGLEGGHAEVGDFDVVLVVEEQVFWLEVPVDNAQGVAVGYTDDDLAEVGDGLGLGQRSALYEQVEQLALLGVLEDHVQVVIGLPDIVETQHIRMIEQLHDDNLALDAVGERIGGGTADSSTRGARGGARKHRLRYHLDSGLLAGRFVAREVDFPGGPEPQRLAERPGPDLVALDGGHTVGNHI